FLAALTVLPKSLSSAASFFGNFATWQVAQLAFGSLALYSFWMSMVAKAALPRATAARVATTAVMDFFMVSSCRTRDPPFLVQSRCHGAEVPIALACNSMA